MGARDLSVVVPVLDESARVPALCRHLDSLQCSAIVVDGGSSDGTRQKLRAHAGKQVRVVQSKAGRATQMNRGAALAETPHLIFLHADTTLPPDGILLAENALANSETTWGRFDVSFDSDSALMKLIAWSMNHRSSFTGICTGDQAMFTTARAFESVGGFPEIPIMEDIALSRRLLKTGRPARIRTPVETASRRWQQNGVLRTVVTMWWLRFLYFAGVSPSVLAKQYRHAR